MWRESRLVNPSFVAWHSSSALVAVASRVGRIFFYDHALVPVCTALANGEFFMQGKSLECMKRWGYKMSAHRPEYAQVSRTRIFSEPMFASFSFQKRQCSNPILNFHPCVHSLGTSFLWSGPLLNQIAAMVG